MGRFAGQGQPIYTFNNLSMLLDALTTSIKKISSFYHFYLYIYIYKNKSLPPPWVTNSKLHISLAINSIIFLYRTCNSFLYVVLISEWKSFYSSLPLLPDSKSLLDLESLCSSLSNLDLCLRPNESWLMSLIYITYYKVYF